MGARAQIGWRRAIVWIAGYALALQTILGGVDLIQNATSAGAFDPSAVVCHGHDADSSAAGGVPDNTDQGQVCGHCGCCLGALAFIEPPNPPLLALARTGAGEILRPLDDWQKRFAIRHPSQPPRGPPTAA